MNLTGTQISATYGNLLTIGTVAGTPTTGTLQNGAGSDLTDVTINGTGTVTTLVAGAGLVGTPAITTSGDLNTGMWFPAADTIAFSTAGAERLRITDAGRIGVNTTAVGGGLGLFRLSGSVTGAVTSLGLLTSPTILSDVTSSAFIVNTLPSTENVAFPLVNLYHYVADQGTITGGSRTTVGNQAGFVARSGLTGATSNFGFRSEIAAAAGRWNFYASGSAQNYFDGNVGIGITTPAAKLQVEGSVIFNDAGADVDFRVESDNNAHALFVEGTNSNVKIGGSAERATTVGTNHLDIFDGTAPVGTLANGVSFYSESGEANVMDAAGNATLLSPHDKDTNEWIFRSKHTPTGKVLKIDVERMLRFINDHFGLDMIEEFTEA